MNIKMENTNIEQWVMLMNPYLIHHNIWRRNRMIVNQLLVSFPLVFWWIHFFFVEKETAATNKDRSPQRKPPVPSIRDAPKMGARTEKNFVQTNALDVVMTVPKKPERNIVDDRFGDKYQVDPSGLQPKYVFKKVRISTFIHSLFVSV